MNEDRPKRRPLEAFPMVHEGREVIDAIATGRRRAVYGRWPDPQGAVTFASVVF